MAWSETTTGGVAFADPLGYTKPQFYPITYWGAETSPEYTYWVDQTGGGGSTCSSGSPCDDVLDLNGKDGTHGDGRTLVYIKGSGWINWYGATNANIYGAADSEVVFKPWDDDTNAVFTGQNLINTSNGGTLRYIIFDGGPNMRFTFGPPTDSEFYPALNIKGHASSDTLDHITFYRVRVRTGNSAGNLLTLQGRSSDIYIINCEFYDANPGDGIQHQVYPTGYTAEGSGSGRMLNLKFLNNIFRDISGDGIEFNLRDTDATYEADNVLIDGNAFHDIGSGTCSAGWGCRPAITQGVQYGSPGWRDFVVSNNIMWNIGESCVRAHAGGNEVEYLNNTCYTWGIGDPETNQYNQYGMRGSGNGTPAGIITNNILYATGTTANSNAKEAFPSTDGDISYTGCESGETCGDNSQNNLSGATFQSLDEDNANFLKLAVSTTPIDNGTDLSGTFTGSYFGDTRSGTFDIGADEYESGEADTLRRIIMN